MTSRSTLEAGQSLRALQPLPTLPLPKRHWEPSSGCLHPLLLHNKRTKNRRRRTPSSSRSSARHRPRRRT
eukprot:10209636-Prorocentrum_lima.AAC.1